MSASADEDPTIPYQKQTVKLEASHRWKAAPGYGILVLDAGAVRFEYPQGWKVIPKAGQLQVHDREPPADECRISITVFRLPKLDSGSWSELALEDLLAHAMELRGKQKKGADKDRKLVSDVTSVRRPDLEYAWAETSSPDPENGRTIMSRHVVARARGVQPLITFEYYSSRSEDYRPVWEHMMKSLRLGSPVNLMGDATN